VAWFRLRFQLVRDQTEAAEELLESLGAVSVTLTDAGSTLIVEPDPGTAPRWDLCWVEALFALPADFENIRRSLTRSGLGLQQLQTDFLEDSDWINHWRQYAVEFCFADRLWIAPRDARLPQRADSAVVLRLDPGLAFGSGSHPTTRLCLEWLARQNLDQRSLLDFGCGSGVLAIAGALLGAAPIVALDHDPQALLATRENAAYNGIAEATLKTGGAELLDDGAAFDVVVANILAAPLIELAPVILSVLKPGGWLVLSGLLEEQADGVAAAYPGLEFAEPGIEEDQQGTTWIRLVARRPEAARGSGDRPPPGNRTD